MLFENFMVDCCFVNKVRTDDGLGGFVVQWQDGAKFKAALVKDNSLNARIAEKEGVTDVYTVTANIGTGLVLNDVIKRLEDGATFKVTSNSIDTQTPKDASFAFEQVSAERWELTR